MMRDYLYRVGWLRLAIAIVAGGVITFNLVLRRFDFSDQIASAIAALVALFLLIAPRERTARLELESAMSKVAQDVKSVWKQQEYRRGLDDTSFIPLRVQLFSGGTENTAAAQFLGSPAPENLWTLIDMRRACAEAVYRFKLRRSVVFGDQGVGKSTLAIALTLGLIDRYSENAQGGLIPVTLSLNSWDVQRDKFSVWLNRRLEATYVSLRSIRSNGQGGIARTLTDSERFVFILDGLDEIPFPDLNRAVKAIDEFFPVNQHLCILTRDSVSPQDVAALRESTRLRLCRSRLPDVRSYLTRLAEISGAQDLLVLRDALHTGRRGRRSAIGRVLRTPLYLRMAYKAIWSGDMQADEIVNLAMSDGADGLRSRLFAVEIARSLGQIPILQGVRVMYWLKYIATDLESRNVRAFAWWRLGDAVPRAVLVVATTLPVVPAYVLATLMPVGLTRGLAIGACAGVILGMLRGYKVSLALAVMASALSWLTVWTIGQFAVSSNQALADATEIALSLGFVHFAKEVLLAGSIRWAASALVLGSLVASGATTVVSAVVGFVDPARGFRDLTFAVLVGIGVAVIAARLLMPEPRTQMQASRIRLTLTRRITSVIPPLRSAVIAASMIGVGGGIGGGVRFGFEYGASLAIFFGFTIGIPAGVAGGFVKWLSLPLAEAEIPQGGAPSAPAEGAPLRSDRLVALASISGLSLASVAAIAVFGYSLEEQLATIRQINTTAFVLEPMQGLLYGLMMGIVVACFFTAWPTYFISHLWLWVVGRRYPWRLGSFLDALVAVDLMRNEGPLLQWRHREVQKYLSQ